MKILLAGQRGVVVVGEITEAARNSTLLEALDGWQQSDATGFQTWRAEHHAEDAFREPIHNLDE